MSHTKGQWVVSESRGGVYVRIKGAEKGTPSICKVTFRSVRKISEVRSNASILSAAPDLFNALKRISESHDCGCVPCTGQCKSPEALKIAIDEVRDIANAAIALIAPPKNTVGYVMDAYTDTEYNWGA